MAALRAPPSWLPDRTAAAGAHGGGRSQPSPPPGDRNAALPETDRDAGDRTAAHGGARARRSDRDRARRPAGAAGEIGGGVEMSQLAMRKRMLVIAAAYGCWAL